MENGKNGISLNESRLQVVCSDVQQVRLNWKLRAKKRVVGVMHSFASVLEVSFAPMCLKMSLTYLTFMRKRCVLIERPITVYCHDPKVQESYCRM